MANTDAGTGTLDLNELRAQGPKGQGSWHDQQSVLRAGVNLPLPVIIMLGVRNRLVELQPLVPGVMEVLSGGLQRRIYRVPQ